MRAAWRYYEDQKYFNDRSNGNDFSKQTNAALDRIKAQNSGGSSFESSINDRKSGKRRTFEME